MHLDQLIKEVESDRANLNNTIEASTQRVALQNRDIAKLQKELNDTEVLLEKLKNLERQ